MHILDLSMGLLFLALGAAIRYLRIVEILAGYDPKKVSDPEGLARWSGGGIMICGAILLAGGFLGRTYGTIVVIPQWSLFTLAVIVNVIGAQRFGRRPPDYPGD